MALWSAIGTTLEYSTRRFDEVVRGRKEYDFVQLNRTLLIYLSWTSLKLTTEWMQLLLNKRIKFFKNWVFIISLAKIVFPMITGKYMNLVRTARENYNFLYRVFFISFENILFPTERLLNTCISISQYNYICQNQVFIISFRNILFAMTKKQLHLVLQ